VVGLHGDADAAFDSLLDAHGPDAHQATSFTVAVGHDDARQRRCPTDRVGAGILHYAALAGNVEWLRRCRTCEAAWTPIVAETGVTIAHYAAMGGSIPALQWIALTLGDESLLVRDNDGDTPAMAAAREGQLDLIRWLEGRLGIVALTAGSGKYLNETLMHVAARHGQVAVLQYAVECIGVYEALACTDADGIRPIASAAIAGHLDVVEFIHNEYVRDDIAAAESVGLLAARTDGGAQLTSRR
jgi:ankyrin repeat protein